jgi:SAM-dependent methyltransferase
MSNTGQAVVSCDDSGIDDEAFKYELTRPSARWRDLFDAPVHDLPIRDEILYQFVPPLPGFKVLEVGPGSGFTAYAISRQVEHLTLVDYAETTLVDLRRKLGSKGAIRFVQADLSQPGLDTLLRDSYDFVFGLDMFEYVSDAVCSMQNLAAVLRPGGVLFLTFPNYTPPRGDGVTWFYERRELEDLLRQAGFARWQILSVALRPFSQTVFTLMHEWPLELYRRLRKRNDGERPQTYEGTWAFRNREVLERTKPVLHLYWTLVGTLLRISGDPFELRLASENLLGCQLVVIAWK